MLVNVEQAHWAQVREEIQALPGLEYLAFTSGSFDMVLLVRVPDIHALRDVVLVRLHGIPHVRTTHTIFVLDEQRLPLPDPGPARRMISPISGVKSGKTSRRPAGVSTRGRPVRTLLDMTVGQSTDAPPPSRPAPAPELLGFDHVEWWVGNARHAAQFFSSGFGFAVEAYAGPETGRARPDVVRAARRATSASS